MKKIKTICKNICIPIFIGFFIWTVVGHGDLILLYCSTFGSILGWNVAAYHNNTF